MTALRERLGDLRSGRALDDLAERVVAGSSTRTPPPTPWSGE